MTGSIESAKDTAKGADTAATSAKASPADLLKKAVAGKVEAKAEATPTPDVAGTASRPPSRLYARLAAVATVALVVGASFGMIAAPRERSGEALARIEAGLDAGRTEANRLNTEIERLAKTLASLRESADAGRAETRAVGPGLTERLARFEQGLDKKFAALVERTAQPEREHPAPAALPAAPVEKRAAIPTATVTTANPPVAIVTPKPEPTQTASITDTKPKSETVEAWALRDVYDGIAMLEDRKRRLLEVAPGDSIPGIGRVDAIERRGRVWVVVTKQGVITPQTW